jgi:hypothetical protein
VERVGARSDVAVRAEVDPVGALARPADQDRLEMGGSFSSTAQTADGLLVAVGRCDVLISSGHDCDGATVGH